jgi:hypothetical protein
MAFTNDNTRVFYATQAVAVGAIAADRIVDSWPGTGNAPALSSGVAICHGLQSIGVDTNFNLEQAFELGQLSLYENIEDIPDISVTMQKFLDGYTLLYHLGASCDGNGKEIAEAKTTLSGRADTRADVRMVINATTEEAVTSGDSPVTELYCSGMYISSVSYTIPTDGTATEDVTFVGNNKKWITDNASSELLLVDTGVVYSGGVDSVFANIFGNDAPAYSGAGSSEGGNVLRRDDVVTGSGASVQVNGYYTLIPDIVEGVTAISTSAFKSRVPTNAGLLNTDTAHIQSFTCSVDLGREQINQLGSRTPYNRYVSFPTEVTSTLEVIAIAGDNVTAVETARTNLSNHEICVVLKDSTVFHLGKKNKVSSVTYGGGDAGGGNATITYNFSNFNDFVVLHSGDPIRGDGSTYWNDKFSN